MAVETVSTVANYITELDPDPTTGDPIYFGRALIGADPSRPVWQIRKFIYNGSGHLTSIRFAQGSLEFTNVWNDRATLSYT